ncbi:MAG TPA: hypothetical protein DEQ87_02180 [Algoriphagus sp.]|jgi:hypothetical protein|uniref:hypothetical protein n=1 Tax=unclassified Algoriphagus TaxID=2641541 RepID=UPI000C51DBC6|nr:MULTISPECIES: hypothetical protein [unclassified Algoriphagus]MAL12798.1 hypothetical protein [Algoriphagus sp.]QYH39598.1 hypothetical protein GYM62_12705 [Algoriphagus sp. NBT04N3]HAD50263.1 hypothetical protein [Algoriphagus sp.]HAS58436.1 hypothetical protein [Algoriphagus sp.]HCB47900.1 hypothetical protein [Algoriphagus sp.]
MKLTTLVLFWILPLGLNAQGSAQKLSFQPTIHARSFWMSTSYQKDFKDDFAWGNSLSLGIKSNYLQKWYFRASIRGFLNTWSSDIYANDPLTNRDNRYETGLFDLLNRGDKAFLSFENLSLAYKSTKWEIEIGRMGVNTPWINPQDGRLAPTLIEGLRLGFNPSSDWKVSGWFIHRLRVRGTKDWLRPGETVGIFPVARDVNGLPSQYFNNTESRSILISEVEKESEWGTFNFSNTWAAHLFSTYWFQWERDWNREEKTSFFFTGLQLGFQHGIRNGGNDNPLLAFKDPSDQNWVVSTRVGWKNSKVEAHLNTSILRGKGRWLSPREWGKDAWYTFIPRERNEGYESLEALTAYFSFQYRRNIQLFGHMGFHWLPDIGDPLANKYAFPSYRQVNLGVKFHPKNYQKLDFQVLVMNKEALGSQNLSPTQRYNKVEMIHLNIIANWSLN